TIKLWRFARTSSRGDRSLARSSSTSNATKWTSRNRTSNSARCWNSTPRPRGSSATVQKPQTDSCTANIAQNSKCPRLHEHGSDEKFFPVPSPRRGGLGRGDVSLRANLGRHVELAELRQRSRS